MTDIEVIAGLPEPEDIHYNPIMTAEQPPRLSVLRETEAFAAIIEAADVAYLQANGVRCPWSPRSIQLLKVALEQHPGHSPACWRRAVQRWYAVPSNRPVAPSDLVSNLHRYL